MRPARGRPKRRQVHPDERCERTPRSGRRPVTVGAAHSGEPFHRAGGGLSLALRAVADPPRARRRDIAHWIITEHPSARWVRQHLREAFPHDSVLRCLFFDRDAIPSAEMARAMRSINAGHGLLDCLGRLGELSHRSDQELWSDQELLAREDDSERRCRQIVPRCVMETIGAMTPLGRRWSGHG